MFDQGEKVLLFFFLLHLTQPFNSFVGNLVVMCLFSSGLQ